MHCGQRLGMHSPPDEQLGLGYTSGLFLAQDLFLASAEKYADHSQLAVRVRAWEERIRPILEAEVCVM
jgi:hypothetical protein